MLSVKLCQALGFAVEVSFEEMKRGSQWTWLKANWLFEYSKGPFLNDHETSISLWSTEAGSSCINPLKSHLNRGWMVGGGGTLGTWAQSCKRNLHCTCKLTKGASTLEFLYWEEIQKCRRVKGKNKGIMAIFTYLHVPLCVLDYRYSIEKGSWQHEVVIRWKKNSKFPFYFGFYFFTNLESRTNNMGIQHIMYFFLKVYWFLDFFHCSPRGAVIRWFPYRPGWFLNWTSSSR